MTGEKTMDTTKLKKFAQDARRSLREQVEGKLALVLEADSAARRENPRAVEELMRRFETEGRDQVVEQVAYTWFNRFCALRFMDVNRYSRVGLVTPAEGQSQPELLADAKQGHIDDGMITEEKRRQHILALLNGATPSRDPQGEAYRLLLVAACNEAARAMPFMFERIADYTELLMPDDLLSDHSILAKTREAMTPEACQDVEVIGWLYQFYISEKKDQVFEGLKKNKKVDPENIPAATQLFTPHWIVRYLVENSLGRLWMLNRPQSRLVDKMDYYIKPEEPETDFLRIQSPEEIRVCDPACGSGHMLTYAFDLLYAIYEEEGYDEAEIPEKILTRNLFGVEIDERAGALAAFALTMKARAKHRRFLTKGVQPNICVLHNVNFEESELSAYMEAVGRDLFTEPLLRTLRQFKEAKHFGSLIRPVVTNVEWMKKQFECKNVSENLFMAPTHEKVLQVLNQTDYLASKYHVVVANPPYMGGRNMNPELKAFLQSEYELVKSDLFSSFILRNLELAVSGGQLGFMTPFVWMFISSHESLREIIINQNTLTSLIQLEYSGFEGAVVPICTFTIQNNHKPSFMGAYIRLSNFRGSSNQSPRTLDAINNPDCGWFYRVNASEFNSIPGKPIAYWVSESLRRSFKTFPPIGNYCRASNGIQTGNNGAFVRSWHEVDFRSVNPNKWAPYNKGGEYRKWFGNNYYVVMWSNNGHNIKQQSNSCIRGEEDYFKPGITWSDITSSKSSFKYFPSGHLFDAKGPSAFFSDEHLMIALGYLNSKPVEVYSKLLNPTLSFQIGDFRNLPFAIENIERNIEKITQAIEQAVRLAKEDWDSNEFSWDFKAHPLLANERSSESLATRYESLRNYGRNMTLEMQVIEEENNNFFIGAYGLQQELSHKVPIDEVTLTCNPYNRYGGNKSEAELEALLLADTMREFISYAVGCMFGRYSIDKPGLVLANQGETLEDYLRQVPEPRFMPDANNVIPVLDGDWFTDDITERFKAFLRVTFGEDHYSANLRFIEEALGKKGKPISIRDYFLKEFYNDHVKRYKKRPIYWLFSSPKCSFNALIYMHRYRPDTVSVVLNDYLREFRAKLEARKTHLEAVSISTGASQGEKTKALKEIESIRKMLDELDAYEHDILYPLATRQIAIDLDDGVKANYPRFGAALKKIPGLDAKDED